LQNRTVLLSYPALHSVHHFNNQHRHEAEQQTKSDRISTMLFRSQNQHVTTPDPRFSP
jgi:hypothetical protein